MKYRIEQDEKGFRALIGKENRYGISYIPIENDDRNLSRCCKYYDTKEDAVKACEKHHIDKGYDKLPRVVDEFELF